MLSRVANSIYWMSRYLERAENIARFIDVNLHLKLDLSLEQENQWEPLIKVTGDSGYFKKKYDEANQDNVLDFLTFQPDYPSSIYSCVKAARDNAKTIREIISSEMWEQVNQFYFMLNESGAKDFSHNRPHEFYTQIKMAHQMFIGLWEGTMSHGEGWHFMSLGRMLERADETSRILDVKYFILLPQVDFVGSAYDNIQWAALLKSTSALEMYRKRFQSISPQNVAEFLIFDGDFPRAVRHCLAQAEYSLHRITGSHLASYRGETEHHLGKLRSQLEFSNIREVFQVGLHQYLDDLQTKLNQIGQSIHETFFAAKGFPGSQHNGTAQ